MTRTPPYSTALLALFVIVGYGGCGVPQRGPEVLPVGKGGVVVVYPADLRAAYVMPLRTKARICAEPAPDVALASITKQSGSIGAQGGGGQLGIDTDSEVGANVVELAGRKQLVLLAREAMYRLCELSLTGADPLEMLRLFERVIAFIEKLGEIEQASTQVELMRLQRQESQ